MVHYLYDDLFRQTKTWSFGVNPVFTFYDNVGATTAWSERAGVVLGGVDVDGFGRPVRTPAGPAGVKVRTDFDACGRSVFSSVPFTAGAGSVGTTTAYDTLGRISTVTAPDGGVTQFSYSGIDVTVVDAEGRSTLYDYSAAGSPEGARLTAVRDAANVTTSYTYDVLDSLTKVSGPGPIPDRTWIYDGSGQLMSDTQPEAGTTTYLHDTAGNLTRKTDAKGQILNFTYDADHRLKTIDAPGSADDVTLTYDTWGRLVSQATSSASITFTYNTAGQLASRTDTVGARTFTSQYGYDLNENLTTITYPSGRVVSYAYDTNHRLTTVRQNGNVFADQFTYDDGGRLASYRTGTVVHTLGYDVAGRTQTLTSGSALNLTYAYDRVGNVTAITEPSQPTQQFGYDTLNRLTSATGLWGQRGWQYAPSGDRLLETGAGTTSYQYDAATRRLLSTSGARTEAFTYSPVGEMTSDARGTYTYNAAGLVTQFSGPNVSAAYSYDPSGLRVAKTVNSVTTYTVRSAGGTVLSEYRGACGTPVWTRDVIYAGARLLGSIKASATDPTVSLTQSAVTVSEATATVNATITLTTPGNTALPCPLTVSYGAIASTAGVADYRLTGGSVTFNAGDSTGATRTVPIEIINDTLDEPDETFSMTLTSAVGAQVGTATLVVTITDEDPAPSLSINDVGLYEGNAGLSSAVFTITLSAASGREVWVAYASSNGSALAGSDYQAVSASVGLAAGLTSVTLAVPIFGDGAVEPSETFQVTLSAPSHATLGDAFGLGTIWNDDAARNTWGDFYTPRDGSADGALFDPGTGVWSFKDSNTGLTTTFGPYGVSGDQFVPADYTGDGITDCAVYRPSSGQWIIAPSCGMLGQYVVAWGGDPTDVPVPADYDGDGKADLAVYRRGTTWWYVLQSSTGTALSVEHGWTWTYSTPVPGDYNGDGRADFAYYAEFNQGWVILYSNTWTGTMLGFGEPGQTIIPTPADYDGDGITDLGYFYPANGTWHIVPSSTGVTQVTAFGTSVHAPVPADYDGDGKFDIAVYDPTYRMFSVIRSSTGTVLTIDMTSGSSSSSIPVLRKPQ